LDWLKKLTGGLEADAVFAHAGVERINAIAPDEQMDPEGLIASLLEDAQKGLGELHETLIMKRQCGRDDPQLLEEDGIEAAYCDAIEACAELGRAVESLRWSLLEHDADAAPRVEGFVADTPKGVADMLDRICVVR